MFEVPRNTAPGGSPRRLALLWIGVAVINLLVVSLLYQRIFAELLFSFVSVDAIVMLNNLLMVALQWLVLRRFFPQMRWWAPAHGAVLALQLLLDRILTGLAKALLFILIFRTESAGLMENFDFASSAIVSLFWALISGIVGWRIFRPQVSRPKLWLVAIMAGTCLQLLISFLIVWPMIRSRAITSTTTYTLINIAILLAVAAIQAAVLMQFLRDRQRPAVVPAWGGQDV